MQRFHVHSDHTLGLAGALTQTDSKAAFKKRSHQQGFALVLLTTLMPVVLAIGFASGATTLVIMDRRDALNSCRSHLINALQSASVPMQELLALNPLAAQLRTHYRWTQFALAAAVARADAPSAAILRARLSAIRMRQQILDRNQQRLYFLAEARLRLGQFSAFSQMSRPFQFLIIRGHRYRETGPALRPMDGNIAPLWEKKPGFKEAQALHQPWQWSFSVRGSASRFLKGSHAQEETCSATLDTTQTPWQARLL